MSPSSETLSTMSAVCERLLAAAVRAPFVLAVGAGDDGAVGEQVRVAVDDGRAVQAGQPGERLLVEVLAVDEVVEAGLGPDRGGVELVAQVVAVLGRDDARRACRRESTIARIAPRPWAETLSAACTTMPAAAPSPMRLAMNDVSSRGNAVQCSPRRSTSGWPSTKAQIVRSAAQVEPDPAQPAGRLRDERAAVEELGRSCRLPVAAGSARRAGGVAARSGRGRRGRRPAATVARRRAAARASPARRCGGVVEAQAGLVAQRVGDDHAVGQVVGLDPRAAQLDEVLDGLGDEVGGRRSVGGAGEVGRSAR